MPTPVAKVWMIGNQLGRRNLTEGQMRLLRGMRMELEKQKEGGDRKSLPQKEGVLKGETAVKLADQYKVSRATIERDAEYAREVQAIATATDTQGAVIVTKAEGKIGRQEVKALAGLEQSNPCGVQDFAELRYG